MIKTIGSIIDYNLNEIKIGPTLVGLAIYALRRNLKKVLLAIFMLTKFNIDLALLGLALPLPKK